VASVEGGSTAELLLVGRVEGAEIKLGNKVEEEENEITFG
jgi:hypothetical protein